METHYEDRAEDLQRLTWWDGENKQNIPLQELPDERLRNDKRPKVEENTSLIKKD